MGPLSFVVAVIVLVIVLAWFATPLWGWTAALAALLAVSGAPVWAWVLAALVAVPLNLKPLRRAVATRPVFAWFKTVLPPLSVTEQIALDAGNTWWDADLFSGRPDFRKLLATPAPRLSPEEQAYIDGRGIVRGARRLGDHRRTERPAARGLGADPRTQVLRHDHPEGVRRTRVLGTRQLHGRDEDREPLAFRGRHRDGPELARPRRTVDALRHRGPETPLPAETRHR